MSNKIVGTDEVNPQLEQFLQSIERDLNYLNDNLNKINSYRDRFDSNRSMKNVEIGDEKDSKAPSNYKERMLFLGERLHFLNGRIESELNQISEFV